ncbi:MAG: hypothetical protein WBJ56_03175 [Dethiobacteria bacterium]
MNFGTNVPWKDVDFMISFAGRFHPVRVYQVRRRGVRLFLPNMGCAVMGVNRSWKITA